jgi:hypothetical protein
MGAAVKWDWMLNDSQGCLEGARGRQGEWEKNLVFPHSPTRALHFGPKLRLHPLGIQVSSGTDSVRFG